MKKFIFFTAVLSVIFSAACCFAKDEKLFQSYILTSDGGRINTTAFSKSGDLWIEAVALQKTGTVLESVLDGKGFVITVQNPAAFFGIPSLEQLAGNTLRLHFMAAEVQKIKYINVSGLEKLTGCFVETSNGQPCVRVLPKEIAAFPAKSTTELQQPIILAWEYVKSYSPELASEPVINGLDVISPTWFNLESADGFVSNITSPAYTAEAHKRGMKVWALVSNDFNRPLLTKAFLRSAQARKLFTAQLLAFSKLYGLDGFNFDFEKIDVADRDAFTQLLREAAPYLKEAGLVVSVDVHKPANTNMSKSHDRKALSSIVDYIMVMTYDQHWAGCPTAGSVADLPWTKYAVYLTLQEGVPAEKMLLGVPLYMRRWVCTPLPNGKEKVKGSTLTMPDSDELIRKHKLVPVWLADKKQDYYEFSEKGQKIKVWVENAKSLAERAALIKEFSLAGAACWRKGHEQPYAWKALAEQLQKNSGK